MESQLVYFINFRVAGQGVVGNHTIMFSNSWWVSHTQFDLLIIVIVELPRGVVEHLIFYSAWVHNNQSLPI